MFCQFRGCSWNVHQAMRKFNSEKARKNGMTLTQERISQIHCEFERCHTYQSAPGTVVKDRHNISGGVTQNR
eukprot:m.606938 g.606938  ORF g.606938 m.606938 type:complete len:72 (+) comp22474_c1_seq1:166-381(+)